MFCINPYIYKSGFFFFFYEEVSADKTHIKHVLMTKIEKGDFLTLCWWLMFICYVTTPPSSYTYCMYCMPYTNTHKTNNCVSARHIASINIQP